MLNDLTAPLLADLEAAHPGLTRSVEPRYLLEPRGKYPGQAGGLALPRDVQEVAAVIRWAGAARVGLVPYGGGTGLVAGQVAGQGPAPLIVSLERMRAVRASYPVENILIAEAGATLTEVHEAAEAAGRLYPLNYASAGSARIGGALSVNSGGVNVLRYGNARDLCLGLEAVLPSGAILHGLKRLRKDNTGYDLRNLLIGAEGTLGIITAAALKLVPRPARVAAALLVVPGPAAALSLLTRAGEMFGPGLTAFELISGQGLHFIAETGLPLRQPFAAIPDWLVLIELGVPEALDPEAGLLDLFEVALQRDEASDGLIAQNDAQRAAFWALREGIPDANRAIGAVASHDISLPVSLVPDFLQRADARVAAIAPLRINCFGHLGDGNLHYNLFPPKGEAAQAYRPLAAGLTGVLHDLCHEMGGSFSAEHGLGRLKVGDLQRYGDPAKLAAMRAIKSALDPLGIMNPGAVLPNE